MDFIKKMNQWREFEKNSFYVNRQMIDEAGELIGGIILSVVTEKFLNNEDIVEKDKLWFQFKRNDFAKECGITQRQLDRSLKVLEQKGLIETKVMQNIDGVPQKHMRLNY